jgi:hypothetical protein
MKIATLKKITLPHGVEVEAGRSFDVTNEYAAELIEKGMAKPFTEGIVTKIVNALKKDNPKNE